MATEQHDEHSPLLQRSPSHDIPSTSGQGEITASRRFAIALPYLISLIAFEIGANVIGIPMSSIQEGIICRKHYPDIDELHQDPRCKSEIVQSELSMLQGWELTFELIPGLLTAVLYGVAADKYGRRIILALSLLGVVLSEAASIIICHFPHMFPLQLIWLAAGLTIVGGGPLVATAMIFVIATDISTEAQRSTVLFYITALSLGGNLIGALLAYVAMSHGEWFSAYVGFGCLVFSASTAFASPETYKMRLLRSNDDSSESHTPISRRGPLAEFFNTMKQAAASIRSLFWTNTQLSLLLFNVVFTTIGQYTPVILMQYITKRFGWSWSEAGLMSSIGTAVNITMVVLILPLISRALMLKFQLSPPAKDLLIARVSITILAIGSFGIGLSNSSILLVISLVTYALGCGYGPSIRSLLATMAQDSHIGILFTTMSVLENIALLISGPLLSSTFRLGMSWHGVWSGLPFMLAGCLLTCATVIIFSIRFHKLGKPARTVAN